MDINSKDRLIFALDVAEVGQAKALVNELADAVTFYKAGMELMMTGEYFDLLDWLVQKEKKVFVDLKLFDVPATVSKAVKRLSQRGAYFTTVHGNQGMMEAAAAEKGDLKILAVTALTSLDEGDIKDLGFACDVQELVVSRARRALSSGCDGIVASGMELEYIREAGVLADDAYKAGIELTQAGAFEGDILAAMQGSVFKGGGDYAGNEFIIGSGEYALLCRYHSGPRRLSKVD